MPGKMSYGALQGLDPGSVVRNQERGTSGMRMIDPGSVVRENEMKTIDMPSVVRSNEMRAIDPGSVVRESEMRAIDMPSVVRESEMGGINPYTYENLMRLPSGETVIQYMADSAGLPVEEVINQMKMGNIPQEGMQMLFEEAFNIMSAPKGGSAMDRYNQRR